MRTHYRLLVISFILSVLAGIIFIIFYSTAIITLISSIEHASDGQVTTPPDPEAILRIFFNPALFISGAIAGIASVTNRIIGIILVAGNKTMKEGERVLWILGFILINMVTNILFLALRKSRNLVPATAEPDQSSLY